MLKLLLLYAVVYETTLNSSNHFLFELINGYNAEKKNILVVMNEIFKHHFS